MDILFIVKAIFVAVAVAANAILALLVYRNNPKSATNRLYGALSVVINLWLLANYASLLPVLLSVSLWLIRLSISLATLMSMFFYLFACTLPKTRMTISKRRLMPIILITVITMIVTLSPLAFTSVRIVNNSPNPVAGPGIGIFALVSTVFSALAVYQLFKKYKKSVGAEKQQFSYTLSAISILLGLLILTVLIPVVAFKSNAAVSLIPLYTVVFLGITTYAIIRHHLFNIKAVIAKSVAYILILLTLAGGYSVLLLSITSLFFKGPHQEMLRQISSVLVAVLLAFTFQPIRQFFNRLTSRVFYQDAYDPRIFLDQFNKNLVSNVEINSLLRQSSQIIEINLKPEFCSFFIRDTAYVAQRNIGDVQVELSSEEAALIDVHLRSNKQKVFIVDSFLDQPEMLEIYKILTGKNIAVIARLVTTTDVEISGIGYLLLGYKKSGNTYNNVDTQVMDILANELVIAVQNALRFEEIEQFNITLQNKIDDATKELKRSNTKLKELDEAKDEFISMASHQLRTPLTSVKGYLSMLDEGDAGPLNETQKKFVDQAFISSQRMVYLIADLLNVSRLKTGKFVIEAHTVYLPDVIESEIAQLYETVKARGLTMTFDKPTTFPKLNLDETKIRQVVMNLADNAIYYTRAGGEIKIALTQTPSSIEFTVKDDGIGVPKSEQHHLFTKFYRAGNARQARPDGTGLGLFMAKKVVVAQGGSLIFKSAEGKGSTFGFSFAKEKLLVTDTKDA